MEQNTIWNKTANYVISDPGSLFCFLHQKNLADSPFYIFFFFFKLPLLTARMVSNLKTTTERLKYGLKVTFFYKNHEFKAQYVI